MTTLRDNWINAGISLDILELLNKMMSFEERVEPNDLFGDENHFEEYEIKFGCSDDIFKKLKAISCEYKSAAIEKNFIYDNKTMYMHGIDARLRIRTFNDVYSTNNTALITVKKPKPVNAEFGAREFEAELLLEGEEALNISKLFEYNGLNIVSSYERVRHYISSEELNVKFDVDLFPNIGRFVEIEGTEDNVMKAAALLNIDLAKTTPDPYDTIHSNWCVEQGLPEEDYIEFKQPLSKIIEHEKYLAAKFIKE